MNKCLTDSNDTNFAENFFANEKNETLESMISLMRQNTLAIEQYEELCAVNHQKESKRLQYCLIERNALYRMPVRQFPLKSDKRCSTFFHRNSLLFAKNESDCIY